MSGSVTASHWSFSCRDVGYRCEWHLRGTSQEEIVGRFREHARCAHGVNELSDELSHRIRSATHPV
jgi:predicted small metal-binding protein